MALVFEPDAPFAVALMILALSLSAGAVASAVMLSLVGRGRRRRRSAPALRRGIEVTAIVGLLLLLRVVDGLTLITGGFIVLGFFVAELILSARSSAPSR
jgi:hypothetical protein